MTTKTDATMAMEIESLLNEMLDSVAGDAGKKTTSADGGSAAGDVTHPKGFDRGLTPSKIIGLNMTKEGRQLWVKWDGADVDPIELVAAKEANEKCPQLVIDFYQQRISFVWID